MQDHLREMRRVVRQALVDAAADGDIDRRDCFRARLRLWRPALVEALHEELVCQLVLEGKLRGTEDVAEIDWDSFLEFIRELLAIIMEFILVFK